MKYKNQKHGGYDSKKEARRGAELALLASSGAIRDLEEQKVFTLLPRQVVNGRVKERAVTYIADFVYVDQDGRQVVEDVKSAFTRKLPAYVIKRKLMLALLGLEVREI